MKYSICLESFTGFYDGLWSWDNFFENSMSAIEEEYGALEHKWDWDIANREDWEKRFATEYAQSFFSLIEIYLGIKIELLEVSVWNPLAYNYATDRIYCDIEIADDKWRDKIVALMDANKEQLSKIISQNHTSYDGFMSFMENSFDAWREIISTGNHEDDDLYVSCILVYLLSEIGHTNKNEINSSIYMEMEDNCDFDVMYPPLEPLSEEAEDEWKRVQASIKA